MSINEQILRVGVVGCGQIADAHLQGIGKTKCARAVAVCDKHAALAEQAAARFDVPAAYTGLEEMLDRERLDVVHITTPATTHYRLAVEALEAGVHVYLEKPFTTDVHEADRLIGVATQCQKHLCVGHDQLFDPLWLRLCAAVEQGDIGKVVGVYTTLNYDMNGPYGSAIISNGNHWVHRLPGGLLQNVISHPLYRITHFVHDASPEVHVSSIASHDSPGVPGDVTAVLKGECVMGILNFSTRSRPLNRLTRVQGTDAAVEIDFDAQEMRRYQSPRTRGAFVKLELPWKHLCEAAGGFFHNVRRFARGDLHYFAGMNTLFERYYRAILYGEPLPISTSEIRRVTWILDEIIRKKRAIDCPEYPAAIDLSRVDDSAPSGHSEVTGTGR